MNRLTEFREVRHIPELLMPWIPGENPLEDGVLYVQGSHDRGAAFSGRVTVVPEGTDGV